MKWCRLRRENSPSRRCVIAALVCCWFTLPAWSQNILQQYVEKEEPAYSWTIAETVPSLGATSYELLLVSQNWRDILWTHQLSILVPDNLSDTRYALLYITGGENRDGQPKWAPVMSIELFFLGSIVRATGSIGVILWQVPNQPLFGAKMEDDLISFTFENFLETGDVTWPLLLPMTKSAVKAMDAVQEFARTELGKEIEKFVVSGASKRGWTTWLTGAVDERVAAIAPMSIDMLNLAVHLDYQMEVWGAYSAMLADYTRVNLPEQVDKPEGRALLHIVDPYFHRTNLTIPKLIFIGTNDPYWPLDAIKLYLDDLPGENYIHYVPNAGHDLGFSMEAVQALTSFCGTVVRGLDHPKVMWSVSTENAVIILHVTADESVIGANLWSASSLSRDFRYARWSSSAISMQNKPNFEARVEVPLDGYTAFYAETIFPSPVGGNYSKCTRVFVAGPTGIVPEPEHETAVANWFDLW